MPRRRCPLTAGYAVPLLMQQDVVGVLAFYTDTMDTPDAALLDTLGQVGMHLGRVMHIIGMALVAGAQADREAVIHPAMTLLGRVFECRQVAVGAGQVVIEFC